MEESLSLILRVGVVISAVLIVLGLALSAVTGDFSCPTGTSILSWVVEGFPLLSPAQLLNLGFLVLITTPVIRIMASFLIFLKTKDAAFTVITWLVMTILLLSFYLGVR